MGKDKGSKAPPPSKIEACGKSNNKVTVEEKPTNQGRGHKQKGAGTVIVAKPPVTTADGIVLKPHERLPSQLLHEFCQREGRPSPKFVPNPPGARMTVILEDSRNSKNDLKFSPVQSAESPTMARDYAALLALFHFQKMLPLERKLPEPYCTTWVEMIRAAKGEMPKPNSALPTKVKDIDSSNSLPKNEPKIGSKPTLESSGVVIPVKLDRETADWLCDACSSQNFAKLLNGQPRVKCFRCQTPKSATCSLVASANSSTTENGARMLKAPPKAITGLAAENQFVSKSEAEQFKIMQRSERNRRMTFFDALKRVNRPKTIHFLTELRNKLEQLLGLQSEKLIKSSNISSSDHYNSILEEIEDEGLVAEDICQISFSQQTAILHSILLKFEKEGIDPNTLATVVHILLEQDLEAFVEDYLLEISTEEESDITNEDIFDKKLENHLRNILSNLSLFEEGSGIEHYLNETESTLTSSNKTSGPYYGTFLQFLKHFGWTGKVLNQEATLRDIIQVFFPATPFTDEISAKAAAIIVHSVLVLLTSQSCQNGLITSLTSSLPLNDNHSLKIETEEEIAVLQSIFGDSFQFTSVTFNRQSSLLFSLQFTESISFFKVPCKVELNILIPDQLDYPTHTPFATISIVEPTFIKSDKILGMIFALNTALIDKLSSLSGSLVSYELFSFLQEKLLQESPMRPIANSPRVDTAKIEDCLNLLSTGQTDELIQLLIAKRDLNSLQIKEDIFPMVESQCENPTTDASSVSSLPTSASFSKKESMGSSFWNRLRKQHKFSLNSNSGSVFPSRRNLPAWNSRELFLQCLNVPSTRAMIVTGETGCGKTTQIPQFISEFAPSSKIIICQPRRLAAIGVATRVAEEQYSRLGDRVGYMVKGDSKVNAQTMIAFCTYGVLLRRLQDDPTLEAIDYIILDEIHERGIDSDFTLALLIDAILKRTNLKLILMSATISTDHFQRYLHQHLLTEIPLLEIPGFTFPVTEFYKGDYEEVVRNYQIPALARNSNYDENDDEDDDPRYSSSNKRNNSVIPFRKKDIDYDLLCKLVFSLIHPSHLTSVLPDDFNQNVLAKAEGCILIFLPGVPEINRFLQFFRNYYSRNPTDDTIHLISLHGNVAPEEQLKIFNTYPAGHLKIIAATNVAEASVTIPDVSVVIDTCRVKEMDYNPEIQAYALTMKFAAKDSLRQRRGRAGRVQKGRCYRLITKGTFEKLSDHSIPEMLRLPLESILLQILAMNITLPSGDSSMEGTIPRACSYILQKCPNIPKEENVVAALQILSSLQAISASSSFSRRGDTTVGSVGSSIGADSTLTPLGQLIAKLPCHPRIGRLLIFGCFLDCIYPTLCVAATLTCRSPFILPNDADSIEIVNNTKRKFGGESSSKLKSDYDIIVNVIAAWERAKDPRKFCKNSGLSFERLFEIKQTMKDYIQDLADIRIVPREQSTYQGCFQYYEDQLQVVQEQQRQSSNQRQNHRRYEYLLSAIYCAGLYPQVCKILHPPKRFIEVMGAAIERDAEAKEVKYYLPKSQVQSDLTINNNRSVTEDYDITTENLTRVFLHPSSVNFTNATYNTSNYLLYGEKSITNYPASFGGNYKASVGSNTNNNQEKILIKDTSEVTPFALVLFGGSLSYDGNKGLLFVDNWISFACSDRIAQIFFKIREQFHQIMQSKLDNMTLDLSEIPIIIAVKELLLTALD